MNAEERAAKILEALEAFCIDREGDISDRECAIGHIVTHIKEAEQSAFEEGQRDMREMAAKVAEESKTKGGLFNSREGQLIAMRIRNLPLTTRGGEE